MFNESKEPQIGDKAEGKLQPDNPIESQKIPEKEKKEIKTFEEFDKVFSEIKTEFLSIIPAVADLSPEKVEYLVGRIRESNSILLKGSSDYEVAANLCQRLVEAYREGNIELCRDIPQHVDMTLEERSAKIQNDIDEGFTYKAGLTVDDIIKKYPTLKYLNTITGGEKISNATTWGPFGNETVGDQIGLMDNRNNGALNVIKEVGGGNLMDRWTSLSDFIRQQATKIQREIMAMPEYQEMKSLLGVGSTPMEREPLRKLYLQKEIDKNDEVLPIAERLEKLFRLTHDFTVAVKNESEK